MGPLALLAVAFALAMDAFAVAIVTGLGLRPLTWRPVARMAGAFGGFQALMPALGWSAGAAVHHYIAAFDHWIACGLLAIVGGHMAIESLREEEERAPSDPTRGVTLLLLAVATSIDAFAVGLSLAMVRSGIVVPVIVIGVVAAVMTAVGMLLGRRLGVRWGKRVEVIGGLVLIAIGVKIVIEHLTA
jgi:manganese efflux pump family protein